jgi:hypothetical protein
MAHAYYKPSRKTVVIRDGKPLPAEATPKEFGRGEEQRDWSQMPYGSGPYAMSLEAAGIDLIPRSEWPDRIAEIKAKKATMRERKKRAGKKRKNQAKTPLCWSFGTVSSFEGTAFVMQGQPLVDLSPASCAAYVTGWRLRGGWNVEAAKHIAEKGLVPSQRWPQTSFQRQYDTPENRELALRIRSVAYIDLRPSFNELATLLLNGFCVATAHDWWGHLVCTDDLVQLGRDSFGTDIENSWSESWSDNGYGILEEGKATPSNATCFHVTKAFVYQA